MIIDVTSIILIFNRYKLQAVRTAVKNIDASWKPSDVGLIQWDGKQVPTLDGGGVEERLPVVFSDRGGSRLLGAPALPPLTPGEKLGPHIADAVVGCSDSRGCSDSIVGMVFDTTTGNTGTNRSRG